MRTKLLLAGWIVGILFPMAWFSQSVPFLNIWFTRIFASNWMHIFMHAMLYGVLSYSLAALPNFKGKRRLVLSAAIMIGVMQELFQTLPAGLLPGSASIFDLGIDLCGILAGLALFHLFSRQKFSAVHSLPPG